MALVPGFTKFDKQAGKATPSGIILQDSAGVSYYLWFDTTGDLRTTTQALAEVAGYDFDASGTAVGAQS